MIIDTIIVRGDNMHIQSGEVREIKVKVINLENKPFEIDFARYRITDVHNNIFKEGTALVEDGCVSFMFDYTEVGRYVWDIFFNVLNETFSARGFVSVQH